MTWGVGTGPMCGSGMPLSSHWALESKAMMSHEWPGGPPNTLEARVKSKTERRREGASAVLSADLTSCREIAKLSFTVQKRSFRVSSIEWELGYCFSQQPCNTELSTRTSTRRFLTTSPKDRSERESATVSITWIGQDRIVSHHESPASCTTWPLLVNSAPLQPEPDAFKAKESETWPSSRQVRRANA